MESGEDMVRGVLELRLVSRPACSEMNPMRVTTTNTRPKKQNTHILNNDLLNRLPIRQEPRSVFAHSRNALPDKKNRESGEKDLGTRFSIIEDYQSCKHVSRA